MTIGTPTLVASMPSLSSRYVYLSLAVTNATANTRVTVRRVVNGFDSTGEPRYYVRGFVNAALSGTALAGYDVEFPQNASTLQYRVVAVDGDTTKESALTSVTINDSPVNGTIDLGADYIIGTSATATTSNPTTATAVQVIVGDLAELSRPARVEVMKPIGRRDPVVVADRRGYPEFDLTLWTLDSTQRQVLENIVNNYSVVTFSPRYPSWMGSGGLSYYVAVKDVREQRRSHLGIVPERAWVLSCQQVGAPALPRVTSVTGW